MMKTEKRKLMMKQFAINAREFDRRNDAAGRIRMANEWRDLATDAEAARAPKYLTWSNHPQRNNNR